MKKKIALYMIKLVIMLMIVSAVQAKNLYIDGDDGSCSDGTRANNNESVPWCTWCEWEGKAEGGDIVYIKEDWYDERCEVSGMTMTSQITIKGYPGDQVNISNLCQAYHDSSNSCWTNISGSTCTNCWESDGSCACNTGGTFRGHFNDGEVLYQYDSYNEWNNSIMINGLYTNTGTDQIWVKFQDPSFNPLKNAMIFSDWQAGTLEIVPHGESGGLKFEDLTFIGGNYNINIDGASNITLNNLTIIGGIYGVYVDGQSQQCDNIVIQNIGYIFFLPPHPYRMQGL